MTTFISIIFRMFAELFIKYQNYGNIEPNFYATNENKNNCILFGSIKV
jgi:hypothetical protein